jgi:excisionase family DNA binding protein
MNMFDQQFIDTLADAVAQRVFSRMAPIQTSPRRLLNVREAAEYLGRTEDAVYQLINRGKIAAIREGRRVHIEVAELDAFVDRGKTC